MRDFFTSNLKLLFAAHHFVYKSKDIHEIASVVNIKVDIVEEWMQSFDWLEALAYWGNRPKAGDFQVTERCWTDMTENCEDLFPINYPDVPKSLSHSQETLEVSTLIKSHLFCIANLTEDEIQERLANEDNDGMKPAPTGSKTLRMLTIGGFSLTCRKVSTAKCWRGQMLSVISLLISPVKPVSLVSAMGISH